MAQVQDASRLSVVDRSGPFMTVVNGTLVARPPRMSQVSGCAVVPSPDPTVRLVFGDRCLVGKSPEGSRQSHTGTKIAHAVCWPVLSWPLPCPRAGRMPKGRLVPYPLIPGCRGASRAQSREHRGFRSRLVADASGAPVLRDQGSEQHPGDCCMSDSSASVPERPPG